MRWNEVGSAGFRNAVRIALLAGAVKGQAPVRTPVDWTEAGGKWSFQSYWRDPDIPQEYSYATSPDHVAGQTSVQVRIQVAAERPRNHVELRLEMPAPLDLSRVEAVELSLKVVQGRGLKPRDVYFCSPDFRKLAVAQWPGGLDLSVPGTWRKAVIDLIDVRILDKANPGPDGEYDRHDVSTICLNFELPPGEVDGVLLLDGMRPAVLPPPPVRRRPAADGSFVVETDIYRVVIGANGYMQSLRAGNTEFLQPWRPPEEQETKISPTSSVCSVGNPLEEEPVILGKPVPLGRAGLEAKGPKLRLTYRFREQDFDIIVQQTLTPRGASLHFALSPDVLAALDGRTDRTLRAEERQTGPQINTRLVTRGGGVLLCRQTQDGYSRMGMGLLPGEVWAFRLLTWGATPHRFTFRPLGNPRGHEALGFEIDCASPDFLLPGGKPLRFDIQGTNYAARSLGGKVVFSVCDYLTRKPVVRRETAFALEAKQTFPVSTDVTLAAPGPYRGRLTVSDDRGAERSLEWVFVYDFPNYHPPSTREADFKAFWAKQLEDLAAIPLDARMTPMPEAGTENAQCYRVSLAALDGRRVHAWYWKPRVPGRYPARFSLPPSGVHARPPTRAPHGPDLCGLWIQIQGLPCDFDPQTIDRGGPEFSYWTHGIESRETSMWRIVYTNLVRGVDFLCSRPEVDAARIQIEGGSQGGGLSIVLAGLDSRIGMSAPAHSGLCRLDWTVLHKPGFWPFGMNAKPQGQTTEQFLKTLSYFDAANFAPDIACPVVAEVSLLDTVTASGNQICALAQVKPGLLQLICDPWTSHSSMPRGARLRSEALARYLRGEPAVVDPVRPK